MSLHSCEFTTEHKRGSSVLEVGFLVAVVQGHDGMFDADVKSYSVLKVVQDRIRVSLTVRGARHRRCGMGMGVYSIYSTSYQKYESYVPA